MAKGSEKKKTNNLIDQQYAQNQSEHTADRTRNNAWTDEYHNRESELYNDLSGGFKGFADTGGLSPEVMANMRNLLTQSGGGGGGYSGAGLEGLYGSAVSGGTLNLDRLRAAIPTLTELMKTGGYESAEKTLINKDINKMRSVGHDQYAGISADDISRMRGGGVFDEFSKTGGLSDLDKTQLRARGQAVIPSFYEGLQNEASRLNKIGNNSNPGQVAMMSRMARDAARGAQGAALDTELGITDRTLQGRKWGTEGMATSEGNIQNLVNPLKFQNLATATENARGIQEFIAAMQLQSGMGLSEVEANVENMLMNERRWGAQGLESSAARAGAGANAAAANARDMLDLEKYFLEYGNNNKFAGLSGLGGLYENNSGNVGAGLDRSIQERGLTGSLGGGQIDQRMANNPQFDWNNFLGNVLGAGAGLTSGIWGGSMRGRGNETKP